MILWLHIFYSVFLYFHKIIFNRIINLYDINIFEFIFFRCLNPIVFIVTAFSTISHSVSLDEISNIRTISKNNKLKYHKTSDHIAVLEYFNNLKKDNLFSSIFNSDTKNFNNHETIKFVQSKSIFEDI